MAKEKLKLGIEPVHDVRQLGVPKALVLGIQHMFAMFGATVLVPLLTGLSVSTALLTAGAGTLLFHLVTGGRVPAFLGSSFAFLAGYWQVAGLPGDPKNAGMLPYACGGVLVAGLVYVAVAGLIRLGGVRRVMRFFPPVVTGPMIILIGLVLAPVAVGSIMDPIKKLPGVENSPVFPLEYNLLIAAVAIVTIAVCNLWGRGMVKIIPILIGIIISYAVAAGLGVVDYSSLSGIGVVHLPIQSNMLVKFNASAIISVVPIALATMMEHVGDISAISATVDKNLIAKPGLHRTLLGDGIATSLAAAVGGPANTTYGENTGVLVLTRVYDPKVMQIAAVMAIIASFIPAIEGAIRSIPGVIIGAVSFILYGMISAIGLRNMIENRVDLTQTRNLLVTAVILVSGLGFDVAGGIDLYFGTLKVNFSGLAIAAILGILLNAILPGKDYEFEEGE